VRHRGRRTSMGRRRETSQECSQGWQSQRRRERQVQAEAQGRANGGRNVRGRIGRQVGQKGQEEQKVPM
ncbi:hypothetical protein E4U43_006970, partial [Claviceps pusilla]